MHMCVQVLAIREGQVRLYGQPKLPTWTLLNATADPGDMNITVNGPVNWVVGDRIAIASSSFYATDIDEGTITNITCMSAGCEVVQLTLDVPLTYTHLGEVVTVPGDDRGHVLDMRAEVAVLNRCDRQSERDKKSPVLLSSGYQLCVAAFVCALLLFAGVSGSWATTVLQTRFLAPKF